MNNVENIFFCCTPSVSVRTCLIAKALPSNDRVYLFIKNLLPSSDCCFVVCFEVVTQYWVYKLEYVVNVNTHKT
jgi:hypothetical protein